MGYYRHPLTTQECRKWYSCFDEMGVCPCRCQRNPSHLVNAWDDIDRSSYGDRCWKRHRKTQYKIRGHRQSRYSGTYASHMKRRDHWHLDHKWCKYPWNRPCCGKCFRTAVKNLIERAKDSEPAAAQLYRFIKNGVITNKYLPPNPPQPCKYVAFILL